MATPDEALHLCFNGEILNYRQLRADLRYPFRTDGDTETLLALHHAKGAAAVDALHGFVATRFVTTLLIASAAMGLVMALAL